MELCASPRPNTSSTCHWASSFCCSACLPGLCSRQVVKKGALRDTQAPEMTGSACQATIGLSAAWRARRVFGRTSPVFIYPFLVSLFVTRLLPECPGGATGPAWIAARGAPAQPSPGSRGQGGLGLGGGPRGAPAHGRKKRDENWWSWRRVQ